MTDKVYFLSDIHLGSSTEPNAFLLLNFLKSFQSTEQITQLFLLGDIFDLWIADHAYFQNKYKVIIDELLRLQNLGVKIHYFEGNHDLHLTKYFHDQLGFSVYKNAHYFELSGKTVRVEHGDEMDPNDKGYLFLRWLLRTPIVRWIAHNLPESFIVRLGNRMSHASRKYTSQVKTITNEYAQSNIVKHALSVWREKPFDLLVSGHVHLDVDVRVDVSSQSGNVTKSVHIVNLGSWFDSPKTFILTGEIEKFISLGEK